MLRLEVRAAQRHAKLALPFELVQEAVASVSLSSQLAQSNPKSDAPHRQPLDLAEVLAKRVLPSHLSLNWTTTRSA